MHIRFRLIGNANENNDIPLLKDKSFFEAPVIFFDLNKSITDAKKAEENTLTLFIFPELSVIIML